MFSSVKVVYILYNNRVCLSTVFVNFPLPFGIFDVRKKVKESSSCIKRSHCYFGDRLGGFKTCLYLCNLPLPFCLVEMSCAGSVEMNGTRGISNVIGIDALFLVLFLYAKIILIGAIFRTERQNVIG